MKRLDSRQVAHFVARGFLRFDGVVPDAINRQFLAEAGRFETGTDPRGAYARFMLESGIPEVPAGTPLADTYPPGSAPAKMLAVPEIAGAIRSLVGEQPVFDHHFLHVAPPVEPLGVSGRRLTSQPTHQDSTIDPRLPFDIQIMYFPHEVRATDGGTRFVPGTHLRVVSEAAIARYQNIVGQQHMVCPAGTILIMHMGVWHGGGLNRGSTPRYMFKIRIAPTTSQTRQWDTSDLGPADLAQRPIFWVKRPPDPASIQAILMTPEPWFEQDTGRLEYLNRIRLWRYLLGDRQVDVDYWLTRVEREV